MRKVSAEEALRNAVASAKMEGLNPTEYDIKLIRGYINNNISYDEFINSVLNDIKK